ncbi:hypothetical protein AVEN_187797-1 [Araneus ventricosus]|uniref:Uncharacterized protein n=1 Tax=Araneus ventricosus TaxID=182803 RepID=A0A4Y2P2N6_ARAVE|nr:hypothetical protein AVEN_252769-1 [Araneus ventricosus]GBN44276.1 hypothetical protein AVEN_187797-1 [Araneus ventricosus]
METTSLIHRPCLSTGDCSIWWSLCDGMGRVQLARYGTPDKSRDVSDWRQVLQHTARSPTFTHAHCAFRRIGRVESCYQVVPGTLF